MMEFITPQCICWECHSTVYIDLTLICVFSLFCQLYNVKSHYKHEQCVRVSECPCVSAGGTRPFHLL